MNRPFWYENAAADPAAAMAFYAQVFGWSDTAPPGEGGDDDYRVLLHEGTGFGGLMPLPEGLSHPFWTMYVGVDDIDAAVADVEGDGGTVHKRLDVAGVGRIAIVGDPFGASFAMIQPDPSDQTGCGPSETACGWHELHASDGEAALAWYGRRFGWREVDAMDMGPMGKYRLFSPAGASDDMAEMIGGAMTAQDPVPPHWELYFQVDGVDAAVERIKAGGGSVMNGPMQVPGGNWVANAFHAAGGHFSVMGPK